MELLQQSYRVLLVSSSEKFNETAKQLLDVSRYTPIVTAADAATARRRMLEEMFDLVMINTPLRDEFGTALALEICDKTTAGVLVLAKAEHFSDINARLSPYGGLVLAKPTSGAMLAQSLQLLCATRERLRRMEQKNASLEEKMEEIRVVNRAKCLLIEQFKMTEKEAHRYIEKQAMDRCVTKKTVAENLLSTYL